MVPSRPLSRTQGPPTLVEHDSRKEQRTVVTNAPKKNLVHNIIVFYLHGFKSMRMGRTLWVIILLKLFILFGVVRLFFLPDYLDSHFATDDQKAAYVSEQITQPLNTRRTP
jgi:hypothetical protein